MKKPLLFVFLFQPPNEKVHQIISRTAMFVSKHGSQSEIILRVKQGDNPTFGFLMPDHRLHPYFRFLVDHQELLKVDKDDGDSAVNKNSSQGLDQTGGALSLLGSVYGSGEDEDGTTENTCDLERNTCERAVDAASAYASPGTEQAESSSDAAKKDGSTSKNPIPSLKEKVPVIKRNHSIGNAKTATTTRAKTGDALDSVSNAANKTSVPSTAKIELPVIEPPSDLKRVIEKIVEFIIKNGKQFEAVLAEQDRAHGRFPFLLPSNQYHTYYLKVLQTAEEVCFSESLNFSANKSSVYVIQIIPRSEKLIALDYLVERSLIDRLIIRSDLMLVIHISYTLLPCIYDMCACMLLCLHYCLYSVELYNCHNYESSKPSWLFLFIFACQRYAFCIKFKF